MGTLTAANECGYHSMTIIQNHASQDSSGWTLTGVTAADRFGLTFTAVVGTNLHYAWDRAGGLTLPSDGRCTLSVIVKSADVPRIALSARTRAIQAESCQQFLICKLTGLTGWHGLQSTQNNSATITQDASGDWVLTANIDFGSIIRRPHGSDARLATRQQHNSSAELGSV